MGAKRRPTRVQNAIFDGDTNALRAFGRAGGFAMNRKRRENREREAALREIDDEIHELSMSAMALEANEDIIPLDAYD